MCFIIKSITCGVVIVLALGLISCKKKPIEQPGSSSFDIPFTLTISIGEQNILLDEKLRGVLRTDDFVLITKSEAYSDSEGAWIVDYTPSCDSLNSDERVSIHEIPLSSGFTVLQRNAALSDALRLVYQNTDIIKIELQTAAADKGSAWIIYELVHASS